MNASSHPGPSRSPARALRAVVAGVFIAGIAALIAFQANTIEVIPAAGVSAPPAFLRAPAADPSLPSADQVFASRPAPSDVAAPTY